jgi:hypothetical protein
MFHASKAEILLIIDSTFFILHKNPNTINRSAYGYNHCFPENRKKSVRDKYCGPHIKGLSL